MKYLVSSLLLLMCLFVNGQSKHKEADALLTSVPLSVSLKSNTISGDKHNYESLSRYAWPDTVKNDGSYRVRDGIVNPEIYEYDFPRLVQACRNIQCLANAFRETGDVRYYDGFCKHLDAWFLSNKTGMNPNFDYAQMIPGYNAGKGMYYGIIEAYAFCDVLESVVQVDSLKSLGKKRKKKLKTWFSDFADWMQTGDKVQQLNKLNNNIAVEYDILLFKSLMYVGRSDEAMDIVNHFVSGRINKQIEPTGEMPAELRRTKAYNYSIYNLQFMLDMAETVLPYGVNLFEESPRLEQAFLFLARFIGHKDRFPYQEISDWQSHERVLRKELKRTQKFLPEHNSLKPFL